MPIAAKSAAPAPRAFPRRRRAFTRNPASQLISRSASNPLYAFVPSTGSTAYANNGRNQVTSVGGVAISYDAAGGYSNGNIDYDGTDAYTYDAFNRLTGVTGKATYLYDALGRLYQEAEATTHRFLYEGDRVIGEQTTSGNLFRRYVPGPSVDEVAVWQSATPAFYWTVTDERGSVIANTTATGSILTAALTYDEYGVPGAANSQRFQYTGQMRLGGTGLYYYKARVYQPTLGRFLQTDPVGYEAGLNLYAYVGADPVNRTDPTGNQAATLTGAGAGCVATGPACPAGAAAGATIGLVVDGVTIAVGACTLSEACRGAVANTGRAIGDFFGNIFNNDEAASADGNDNPYDGPVDGPVVVVDSAGNAIPVGAGEQVTSSPDGDYQQVRDREGRPTGIRADRGGHRGQSDEAARGPHGHRPDVTRPGENPHLPIRPRLPREP